MAVFTGIALATAYIAAAGVAAGLSVAAAGALATFAVSTAISIGISLIARMLQPSVSIPRTEIQAVLNQTDAPRRVYVGQNLAGGIRALYDVKDGMLYQLVVVSHGAVSGFNEFWIDGEPVELDETGSVIGGKMEGFVTCQTRDGTSLGGDYADLISEFSTWDADRKLTGQATFLARMKAPGGNDFAKIFPKSYNTSLQWVIQGQEVYYPHNDTIAYSDNAALVIAHYLTHADGFKLDHDELDWDNVKTMGNVAQAQIPQKEGGTAPSLRLWGYWTLDEGATDVLARMHSSSGIRAYEMQDGRIGLIGGNFGTPSMTLTAKDIRQIQTSEAINEREGYNILRVFHLDASQKYEVTEVDAWRDEDRLLIEGEVVEEYKMEMCPNRSQARRLAKQQIHNDNRAKVEIVTNLVGLKARFPKLDGQRHTILLDYRPEDGSGRVIAGEYEVMNHEFDPVALECSIELAKVDRASEEWTVEEEGEPPSPLPVSGPDLAPEIVAVVSQRVVITGGESGGRAAMIEVDAVPIAGRDDITLRAQYKLNGPDTQWRDMQTTEYSAVSNVVSDGSTYQIRVKFDGVFDEPDTWHSFGNITITTYTTVPGAPTDLIPSNGAGYVHLSWRNPNQVFADLRIYRSTGTNFPSAALVATTGGVPGQISEYQDGTIASETEYNYWVAAANGSGIEGAPVGPANITTT